MDLLKKVLKKIGLFELVRKIYRTLYPYFLELTLFFKNDKAFCNANTLRCLENKRSVNYNYPALGKNSPVCCNTHLYEILRDVTSILEDAKITYFINYGTLLGAVRHKGLIPWDTDVDLGILRSDLEKIENLMKEKLSTKYYINRDSGSFLRVYFSKINTLHLDFDIWDDFGDYLQFDEDVYFGTVQMPKDIF